MHNSHVKGRVVRIVMSNPPVNALNLSARRHVLSGIEAAMADESVVGVVLLGDGGRFSGGADVREFNKPDALSFPSIIDVGKAIQASPKPVVAAIDGVALGGGLELAMFCHLRVASSSARLGLPEASLGLLPGAGGTQRLPRLVGAERAIDWMVRAKVVGAHDALTVGLIDEVVLSDVGQAAEALVRRHLASGNALPVAIDRVIEVPGDAGEFFEASRAAVRAMKRGPAPEAIVDCVEAAATMPHDRAADVELQSFDRLSRTPESLALRHLFFAERAAARIDGLNPAVKPLNIGEVGVLGAGTMGTGIAMAFANAGYDVWLTDTNPQAMQRSRAVRAKAYESAKKRGRMSVEAADQASGRIRESSTIHDLQGCELVIEAVVEKQDVKEAVLGQLARLLGPHAVIASNTSYLNIDALAASTGRPQDVLGLHFFSPAHVMKLVEVVRGRETSDRVLATAMDVLKRIGKMGVMAGVCDGFIGNRMVDQYFLSANELLMEGATPNQVDDAIRDFGFAMGPFAMSDMAGNDIGWLSRRRRIAADPDYRFPAIADAICERGWHGQKAGKGYFVYENGSREPGKNAEFEALLRDLRAQAGIEARRFEPAEIVERCVFALVNEGARILEEGIAQRASDIDVVYVRGYGFPDLRGGPMHYAESIGLDRVLRAIEGYRDERGDQRWSPAPLLVSRAAGSGRFDA